MCINIDYIFKLNIHTVARIKIYVVSTLFINKPVNKSIVKFHFQCEMSILIWYLYRKVLLLIWSGQD